MRASDLALALCGKVHKMLCNWQLRNQRSSVVDSRPRGGGFESHPSTVMCM